VSAGEAAVKAELAQSGHGGYTVDTKNVVVKALDLNSLSSVKAFAQDFLATEKRLDFLVLNAGIMALPKHELTDAGFERQIGVNHFGHAYLVQLLQDKMLTTPDTSGRIVVLSSVAHDMGKVIPSDLHYTKGRPYKAWEAYGQSKLANLLYAKGLADKLKGTPATAVAVHPGVINTNLWR
jgi:NAD(P)-dependent dehydrogenase (short-subunit alcohol dehydrogenase family)